ncbi:hypothetical protein [Ectopseudomonas guguanensis]|uniref:Lipoprotein n=1 Tax=Ectopseudomonas guguanensis TaxID=1198456 RepID=A0A1H0L438_9GAMM|nr:hypothetical protein [Pseudomonas guguanensis]SDO62845.1 hypothetical protein SAMN05216213_101465 [Pseudomonas guguanensis]
MPYKILLCALLLSFAGCAVYGGGYDRGYHNGHAYRYHDGYRRDHYAPPVYVTPRYYYYEDRRQHYYPAPPRHVPAPPPRHHYGHDHRYRDGYKRHEQPRHEHRRGARRQEHRGGQVQRGWDSGRGTQLRFSNGRSNDHQQRGGERRW